MLFYLFPFSPPLSFLWLCRWCICRRHNIRTPVQLIEPICCRLLPLSVLPLDNTLSHNSSLVPLLHLTKKTSSFDLNTPFLMHFIPCAIYFYLGQGLSSPSGPMNSASLLAASTWTRNTRGLGSLTLTPGQVSSSGPRPPPMHPCLSLLSFARRWNNLDGATLSLAAHLNNQDISAVEATDMEWCLLTDTVLNHLGRIFFFPPPLSGQGKDTTAYAAYDAL